MWLTDLDHANSLDRFDFISSLREIVIRESENRELGVTGISVMQSTIQAICLTLERSVDRQRKFSECAERAGLRFEFFYGTDAYSEYDPPRFSNPSPRSADLTAIQLSEGEIACADSHRRIYQHVLENRLPGIFIFEDDALFDWRTTQLIDELADTAVSMKDRSLVLHVSDRDNFKSRPIALSVWARLSQLKGWGFRKVVRSDYAIHGTYGYYITHRACSDILSLEPVITFVADAWDDRLRKGHIKELWVSDSPLVCHPELADDSLIAEGRRRRHEISKDHGEDECRRMFKKIVRIFRRTWYRLIRYPLLRLKR